MAQPRDPVILRREDYRRDMERMAEQERTIKRLMKRIDELERENKRLDKKVTEYDQLHTQIRNLFLELRDVLNLATLDYPED